MNENQFQTESNEQWTEEKGWNGTTSGDCDRDGLQQRQLLLIESRHGNDSSLTNGSKSHLQWTVHTNTGMYHSRILATNYRFWLQRFDIKNTLCGSVTRFTVSHTWRPIIWEEVFLWVAAATRTYGERGKNVTTPLERGIHASDNDEKFLIISTLDETSNFTFIWMLPYFIKNQVKHAHTKSCWSKRIDKMILLEVQAWFVRLILKELNNLAFLPFGNSLLSTRQRSFHYTPSWWNGEHDIKSKMIWKYDKNTFRMKSALFRFWRIGLHARSILGRSNFHLDNVSCELALRK